MTYIIMIHDGGRWEELPVNCVTYHDASVCYFRHVRLHPECRIRLLARTPFGAIRVWADSADLWKAGLKGIAIYRRG